MTNWTNNPKSKVCLGEEDWGLPSGICYQSILAGLLLAIYPCVLVFPSLCSSFFTCSSCSSFPPHKSMKIGTYPHHRVSPLSHSPHSLSTHLTLLCLPVHTEKQSIGTLGGRHCRAAQARVRASWEKKTSRVATCYLPLCVDFPIFCVLCSSRVLRVHLALRTNP